MEKWKVHSTKVVLKDRWIEVRADCCETGHGVQVDPFYTYHPKDWVLIAAQTNTDEWLIVRQYRHGIQDFDFEFPAGNCEAGDTPFDTAKRELLEETGFGKGEWVHLKTWPFNTANHRNYVHAFWAQGVEKIAEVCWDENEEIELHFWNTEEIRAAVHSNKMSNPIHQLLSHLVLVN